MMGVGSGRLTFAMRHSRPTARTQAALDELVAAKLISCEKHLDGAIEYRPLQDFWDYCCWIRRNPEAGEGLIISEPITE